MTDGTMKITFCGEEYELYIESMYYNAEPSQKCLVAFHEGCVFGKITCCIPGVEVNDGEVLVKTWSENEWVRQLLESPLFSDTGRRINTGYCDAEVWRFNP